MPERARRQEAQLNRVAGEQQRPEVEVRRGPALRVPDPHEAVVEVVVVGAPRRPPVLEPLHDDERRVEDRHRHHEQRPEERDRRGGLQDALDGDRREQEAEREGPRVAHEDLRRVVVVPQERQRRAEDDRCERRRVGAGE